MANRVFNAELNALEYCGCFDGPHVRHGLKSVVSVKNCRCMHPVRDRLYLRRLCLPSPASPVDQQIKAHPIAFIITSLRD